MIAERYAKAIYDLAKEESDCREIGRELEVISKLLKEVEGLKEILLNPAHGLEKKRKAIEVLGRSKILSPLAINFLLLLVKKSRLANIAEICESYDTILNKEEGRLRAEVFLALEVDKATLQGIKERLEEITGKEVVMSVTIDPGLIGGVVIKVGDLVFDGSIKAQLGKIKDRLKEGVL